MDDTAERLLSNLARGFGAGQNWWLDGLTLRRFCQSWPIEKEKSLTIGMVGGEDSQMDVFGTKVSIHAWQRSGGNLIRRNLSVPYSTVLRPPTDEEIYAAGRRSIGRSAAGLRQYHVDPLLPYQVQVPFMVGGYLDVTQPGWYASGDFPARAPKPTDYMTPGRKAVANSMVRAMYGCAQRAGVDDLMWLCFGGLLGLARHGDWIPHDNDMDMGLNTPPGDERATKYIDELRKGDAFDMTKTPRSMFEARKRGPTYRKDGNGPLWLSLAPIGRGSGGVKSCNWFWFRHGGYYWHSKGGRWVSGGKFRGKNVPHNVEALALGIPEGYVKELVSVAYHGNNILVPKRTGACLDWWYPGWPKPAGGNSSKSCILVIPQWSRSSDWWIEKNT